MNQLKTTAMIKFFAAAALTISSSALAESTKAPAFTLTMISGCWQGTVDGATVEERWDAPRGNLMLGTAKTVVGDTAVEFEFLKISMTQTDVLYTPYINGVADEPFVLDMTASNHSRLVFANPANEFPKQIIYSRTGHTLDVSLLGSETSQAIQYSLAQIDCVDLSAAYVSGGRFDK